jgi:uncharacterized protein
MPTPNHVSHFAVHAENLDRARRFYTAVFGWTFEAWGPPDFFMIKTAKGEDAGMFGSLTKREAKVTGEGFMGFECTIAVDDVDATAKKVAAAGGTVIMKKVTIGTVGELIKFTDTEGNRVGAMRYDPNAV